MITMSATTAHAEMTRMFYLSAISAISIAATAIAIMISKASFPPEIGIASIVGNEGEEIESAGDKEVQNLI